MPDIGWVDTLLLAILGFSVIVGLMRGLLFEVLSLLGWIVAYVAAQWFAPDVGPHLPIGTRGSALNWGASFACTFVVVLLVWSLAARLLRMFIHATPLSVPDRLLGAVFGLARGGVVLLALATLVALTPGAASPAWKQSHGAVWLNGAMHELKPVLPPEVSKYVAP